jgi:carbon monoxide dehydrogenase subunit G
LPSSIQANEEITFRTEPDRCFQFFTDLSNIGSCIPGCEQVSSIDSNSAVFKVKVKIGYISRTFDLRAKLLEQKPPDFLTFTAEGQDAEIKGTVRLSFDRTVEGKSATTVNYSIEIRPISVMGKTAISMIGKDFVKKQASEFAICVKNTLES